MAGRPPGGRPPLRPGQVPPGARRPGDGLTEHLPPVAEPKPEREPELLTHREDDFPGVPMASRSEGPDGEEGGMRPVTDGPKRVKLWRRVRRTLYVLIALGIFAPVVAFFVMYQIVTVPDPTAVEHSLNEPVTIYYGDGSVLTTLSSGTANHSPVTYDQIPPVVKHAVEAAEDETFDTNPGFDLKAIFRTAWNKVSGAQGGASTISQEYIKQATDKAAASQRTASNKIQEIVQAYKMTRQYGKQDILTGYLNIVYFGRGAYGIKAAAKEYFGIDDINKLSPEQAALLAGLIQNPSRDGSASYRQFRYSYVMGRMAANGWIPQSEVTANPTPPAMVPAGSQDPQTALPYDRVLIVREVENELAQHGWSLDALKGRGAKIYTSIDPKAQQDAEDAVNKIMPADAMYPTEATALVSVDQHTGNIIAWYGGNDPKAAYYDLAATPQDPGSSFKPYVFAAGLEHDPQQIGLNAVYNGSDNQVIAGQRVHNADGENCAACTVKTAMTDSINTVFYQMGASVGVHNVQQAAYGAGIPQKITNPATQAQFNTLQDPGTGVVEAGISIGQYPVRPEDQAQGYATIANDGMRIPIHFVTKLTDNNGAMLYQFNAQPTPWFDNDPTKSGQIAHTVTDSMTQVAQSSGDGLDRNRPNAAKTGTAQFQDTGHDSEAWMVGFTPQVTTAVWFGNYDKPGPIYGNYHNGKGGPSKQHHYDVYGREEPGYIWQAYMNSYLANTKPTPFQTGQDIGGDFNFATGQPGSQTSSGDNNGSTDNSASNSPSSNSNPDGNPTGAPAGGPSSGNNTPGQGFGGQQPVLPPAGGGGGSGGRHHKPGCNPLTGCKGG